MAWISLLWSNQSPIERLDVNMKKWYIPSFIGILLFAISVFPLLGQNNGKKSFGIDVSHHNGIINWKLVETVEFVYVKATEGATYVDPKFQQNLKGARDNKQKVGAYHNFRTSSSVQSQFNNYKKHVKKDDIDIIPMVDVEECKQWSAVQFQDSLMRFIELVKTHYGKAPMIYSVNTFYNKYCAPKFNNYHLMIGRYGSEKPFIKGEGTYTIWQKSQTGKLNGIVRNVDIDVFHPNHTVNDILMDND